jgi:hypothetical protein
VISVRERREYALVVLDRLLVVLEDEEVATAVSSSELVSGSARFFPFGSRGGSWIVMPVDGVGYVALRALYELLGK